MVQHAAGCRHGDRKKIPKRYRTCWPCLACVWCGKIAYRLGVELTSSPTTTITILSPRLQPARRCPGCRKPRSCHRDPDGQLQMEIRQRATANGMQSGIFWQSRPIRWSVRCSETWCGANIKHPGSGEHPQSFRPCQANTTKPLRRHLILREDEARRSAWPPRDRCMHGESENATIVRLEMFAKAYCRDLGSPGRLACCGLVPPVSAQAPRHHSGTESSHTARTWRCTCIQKGVWKLSSRKSLPRGKTWPRSPSELSSDPDSRARFG